MPKISLFVLCLCISVGVFGQSPKLTALCQEMDELNTAVTNGRIAKKMAAERFGPLINDIRAECSFKSNASWVFPLAGYKANAIGGVRGNGYHDKGYHYLDGNKHTAHPAHDIFITDRDQNDLDDKTGRPIEVLAVTDGVVLACSNQWEPNNTLRGGKYIWLYHPSLNIISYYAHNRAIFVKPGDVVKQGQKLAEVGRTGMNAYKKRSPTHLHFSGFKILNSLPVPFNTYTDLIQSKCL